MIGNWNVVDTAPIFAKAPTNPATLPRIRVWKIYFEQKGLRLGPEVDNEKSGLNMNAVRNTMKMNISIPNICLRPE